jgi:hypothetical protein
MVNDHHERLIQDLGAVLTPVRRLAPPGVRALAWLAVVATIALALAVTTDVGATAQRLAAAPDMWLGTGGSALTAMLAVVAAFHLDLPDRSRAWALLPLPAAMLWIGASGIGCFRSWFIPDTPAATLIETETCLIFILGLSAPLAGLLIVMLKRGYALQPGLTAAIGGLACASAAATLLTFVHPYDASVTDLAVHALSVLVVILVMRTIGGRVLTAK